MLLNKTTVLDKGFVALLSSCNNGVRLKELRNELFRAQPHSNFNKIAQATLYIKCPLFVQLYLSKYNLNITPVPPAEEKHDIYLPDQTEVGSTDQEVNKLISDDIYRTSEALMINPLAYQKDGCDRFVSQVLTPINLYTELIVHGNLEQWLEVINQENIPAQIKVYKAAIEDILKAEWYNIDELLQVHIGKYRSEKMS